MHKQANLRNCTKEVKLTALTGSSHELSFWNPLCGRRIVVISQLINKSPLDLYFKTSEQHPGTRKKLSSPVPLACKPLS